MRDLYFVLAIFVFFSCSGNRPNEVEQIENLDLKDSILIKREENDFRKDSIEYSEPESNLNSEGVEFQHQNMETIPSYRIGENHFLINKVNNNYTIVLKKIGVEKTLKVFKNLKPSPIIAGVFLPKAQLIKNFVLFSVFGNDENKLLLFDKNGKEIWNINGGEFFTVSYKNMKYLITIQDIRSPVMAIYNIDLQKIIKKDIPLGSLNDISNWLMKNDKLFALKNNGKPDIIGNYSLVEFNWDTFSFSSNLISINQVELEKFKKIKFDYKVTY